MTMFKYFFTKGENKQPSILFLHHFFSKPETTMSVFVF